MKKFICKDCQYTFNLKKSKSLLVKFLINNCPKCNSSNIVFTEYGKLVTLRKIKIEKLNKSK